MEINALHGFPDIFEVKSISEKRVYHHEVLESYSSYQSSAL